VLYDGGAYEKRTERGYVFGGLEGRYILNLIVRYSTAKIFYKQRKPHSLFTFVG
jgi:hypothetical protein